MNKKYKNSKTLYTLCPVPYQNWMDLGRLGWDWTKSFTIVLIP